MPTQDDLPHPDKVLKRITQNRNIDLDPDNQSAAEFLHEAKKLPRDKRVEVLFGVEPFEHQRKMLQVNLWRDHTRVSAPTGRRGGKTFTGSLMAADAPLTVAAGEESIISAPLAGTAQDMFSEATSWYYKSPWPERFGMSATEFFGITTDNKTRFEFANGAEFWCQTTGDKGTALRGNGPVFMAVDEAHFVNNPHEIYVDVIEPFFETHDRSEFYMFSTTNGQNGYFYEKSIAAGEQNPNTLYDWFRFQWPSIINPLVNKETYEFKREQLDSLSFRKEWKAEFVAEGNVYIPHSDYKASMRQRVEELSNPRNLQAPIYGGLDVARYGTDETVLSLIDGDGRSVIYQSMPESSTPEVVGLINACAQEYQPKEILIDENGLGGGSVDFAKEYEIECATGVTLGTKSKSDIYKSFKADIENRALALPDDKQAIHQTTNLAFKFTPNGHVQVHHSDDDGHDDYPDSLALAAFARNGRVNTSEAVEPDVITPVVG